MLSFETKHIESGHGMVTTRLYIKATTAPTVELAPIDLAKYQPDGEHWAVAYYNLKSNVYVQYPYPMHTKLAAYAIAEIMAWTFSVENYQPLEMCVTAVQDGIILEAEAATKN